MYPAELAFFTLYGCRVSFHWHTRVLVCDCLASGLTNVVVFSSLGSPLDIYVVCALFNLGYFLLMCIVSGNAATLSGLEPTLLADVEDEKGDKGSKMDLVLGVGSRQVL